MNLNSIKSGFTILTGSILLAACGGSEQQAQQTAPPPTAVSTYTVEKENVTTTDEYPGVVVALNEVELRAEVGGYITAIYVKDGQKVTKGQRLYEIDRTNYQAAYNSAKANLEVALANKAKAEKDAQRYTALAEKEAIAKQRVDYALTDLANASSQVAAAQASLATAQANLNRSIITSPLTGTIGISQVKLGALVSPGTTLLNTVSTDNPMAVDISVNQKDIQRFLELQKNPAQSISDSIFSIEQNGISYSLNGSIVAIDRAVDPGTGTIKVRISYPNPSGILVSGMTCNVKVLNKSSVPQIVIPHKAVTEQLGKYSVFVVGDSSKVEQRIIQTGSTVQDQIVVTEGLNEGEVIVSEGTMKLRPGATIQVTPDTAAATN
ncbi:efflux RND transporter periplasmic adaptor subunit [Albibacterium bauzanense]|uniref:Membrane fusion protein (Multidrug efflux system) n=1 Tax=Albibacterium bauzanense TaxID=653929 RepID=A0A4R1LNP1_9SPHI|nr:efflux RND transporter periplasmic adaptor subunit [Albibacterium bauzanense]TCK80666.1 membrane fusion protein (multidrug efflux system) [Albibacterium bauzanense]